MGIGIFPVGDSRTKPDTNPWRARLALNIIEATGQCCSCVNGYGTGGETVEVMEAYVTANLATDTWHPTWFVPDYVLINLGANDVKDANWPTEADFKSDYQSILDQFHAEWPNAKMYLMRIWRTHETITGDEIDTLDGWIDDVIASRDFAYAGPDERVWLENGDGGTTYTDDGAHYNDAGQTECAAQWQSVLGY